jgi:hypothetical protein
MSEPSDGEYPQLWEIHAQLVAARVRILQSIMAFYIEKDSMIEEVFAVELAMGVPVFVYVPQTAPGQASKLKFDSIVTSYQTVFQTFTEVYDL